MELILISNSKLKIMLDENDMQQYHICDEADCAQAETRRAIRSILDRAKDQVGFNTEGSEIFVQLYTSKKGGCELFVTKSKLSETLSEADSRDSERPPDKKQKKKDTQKSCGRSDEISCKAVTPRGEITPSVKREYGRIAFSFLTLEDILSVCRILNDIGIDSDSRAYADDLGNFYLIILNTGMSAYSRLDKLTFILEYGERENVDILNTYVSEHGRMICGEHAIEILGNL